MASKYICIYNGMTFTFDDKIEFATKFMGYKLNQRKNGAWDVIINREEVAHYSNEYTREEIEIDFFRNFFVKFTFKNLHFYQLI